ncbi:glucose 1-dehydrogenase [Occultella kanbiaonis]|uniref:glucose 1-dehydrogenase n=1 Tax=Occultella kanbiaonis TaxID=2675754 RepID=UPI0013D16A2D|nr:glucose 1-dehydrogenase [Occultella kanbiaonis]
MGRVEGKVALITGGARGIGASAARLLVAEGAKVMVADVLDVEGKALALELGPAAAFVSLDVTDRSAWSAAVAATTEAFGGLDVLVNNAGISDFGPLADYPDEAWDKIIGINLTGVFNGCKAALPALRASERNPSIVNISSTAGLQGYPALSGYVASKWAVRGLTKALAVELGPENIRVNSIHPGAVATDMTSGLDLPQKHVALKRIGLPDEIGHLVVYLSSDESTFSTGAEFVADGGELAGLPA